MNTFLSWCRKKTKTDDDFYTNPQVFITNDIMFTTWIFNCTLFISYSYFHIYDIFLILSSMISSIPDRVATVSTEIIKFSHLSQHRLIEFLDTTKDFSIKIEWHWYVFTIKDCCSVIRSASGLTPSHGRILLAYSWLTERSLAVLVRFQHTEFINAVFGQRHTLYSFQDILVGVDLFS